MTRKLLAIAVVLAALPAACAKPVPLASTPAQAPGQNADSLARARRDSIAGADAARQAEIARAQAQQDSLRAVREREQRAAATGADAMNVLRATVYYEFDSSTITDAAHALLLAKVPVLQAAPTMRIRIMGHTDSRGSSEYNLALGLRRAAEAKSFLVSSGIDGGRIDIGSLGEEMPAVQGENEEAWSKNRRAEFAQSTGENE